MNRILIACALAAVSLGAAARPLGGGGGQYGEPIATSVSVTFTDSSSAFRPDSDTAAMLAETPGAAMVTISGRTSTASPSARDEALALARALSARRYLIAHGVSPLKIMVNFASATDYATDNSTAEGRATNQRVDIEAVYVPRATATPENFSR